MTSGEINTAERARAVLGVPAQASAQDLRAAFQRAAKASHPDRGGDADRFRQVIDAYRLLKAAAEVAPAASAPRPDPRPRSAPAASAAPAQRTLKISVAEAFLGAHKTVRLADGRKGKVKLPPGLRSGEVVRFGPGGDQRITVSIAREPRAEVRGDDLWLTVSVTPEFLNTGGRLEVQTPFGRRRLWISRTSAARGLFRAPSEGLPATDVHPRGHLYLKMLADADLANTPAKSLLRRFSASWAA
jgi:curved DNA-binding protein